MFSSASVFLGFEKDVEGAEVQNNSIQYTIRDVITINSDSEFTAANGVTGGSGTSGDPWIIEGYDIDGTDSGHGIYVGNVTEYFSIQHCNLHNISDMWDDSWLDWYAPIVVQNAPHGTIYNNSIEIPHGNGIWVNGSSNITIKNNFINSLSDDEMDYVTGVFITGSVFISASYNKINRTDLGISFRESTNNTIEYNLITNSLTGLSFYYASDGNNIQNNTFKNNTYVGIALTGKYHVIRNNSFFDSGITFGGYTDDEWGTHIIDDTNTVNGKPIYYIKNQLNGIVPSDAGQLILVGCAGVTIEDLTFNNTSTGIQMYDTSWSTIRRVTVKDNNYGIRLRSCGSNNMILDSVARYNNYGMTISESNYNYVSNVSIENNSVCGIFVGGSEVSISDNRIFSNGLSPDDYSTYHHGVFITSSTDSRVENNEIGFNGVGIELDDCENTWIKGNTMTDDGLVIRGDEIEEWNSHDIDSANRVNGKMLEYHVNQTFSTIPAGAGQIILVNCSYMAIVSQDLSKSSCGLQIAFSDNITINYVNSDNSWNGAFIWNTPHVTVMNSTFSENERAGLYAYTSANFTIENSNLSNNVEYGINSWILNNSIIDNCKFYDNSEPGYTFSSGGVDITGSNISITDSIFYSEYGILLHIEGYQPYVNNCDFRYSYTGIQAYSAFYGTFTNNIFYQAEFGIGNSEGNMIYGNIFIENTYHATDYCEFESNSWDNGYPEGGNYWSDYTGYDNYSGADQDIPGSDGIGDTGRDINGGSAGTYNVDNYPIMEPSIDLERPQSLITKMKYHQNSPITITANASDEHSTVEDVDLYYRFSANNATDHTFDYQNWTNWTFFDGDHNEPWSWDFDFPDGIGFYKFISVATDSEDNIEMELSRWERGSASCAYNNTPPSITLISPQNNSAIQTGTIIDFEITGDNVDIVNYTTNNAWNRLWEPYNISTLDWPEGVKELEIKAIDKYGNLMHKIYNFTFDDTGPSVISTSPFNGEVDVLINATIDINFSEPVNVTSAEGSISISNSSYLTISNYDWSNNNSELSISLLEPLDNGTEYNVRISSTSICDETRNYMSSEYVWTFITWLDTDNDGLPDSEDEDDDNDGYLDIWEDYLDTDPKDPENTPLDTDGDGMPDGNEGNTQSWMDTDDDNDGVSDSEDYDPLDPEIQNQPTSNYFWAILIIVLLIALLVFVVYYVNKPSPDKKSQEPPEDFHEEDE